MKSDIREAAARAARKYVVEKFGTGGAILAGSEVQAFEAGALWGYEAAKAEAVLEKTTCPICGGLGWKPSLGPFLCSFCAGTGRRLP